MAVANFSPMTASIIANPVLGAVLAGAGTGLLSVFARPLGRFLGLMDDPRAKAHSFHDVATPLIGGIAIILPWLGASIVSAGILPVHASLHGWWPLPSWLIFAIVSLVALGAIDDRIHLSPRGRLVAMFAIYALAVGPHPAFVLDHIGVPLTNWQVHLGGAGIALTVLALTALTNAVNMADGRNGIVIGMVLIWQTAICLLVAPGAAFAAIILAASLVIGLAFNLRGKFFLGDAGAYGLAAITGFSVIWMHNSATQLLSTSQAMTFFLIPALDMMRLILVRLCRGASPMKPDHDHLHHWIDQRCGWERGLKIYLALVAIPLAIALSGPHMGSAGLIIGCLGYFAVIRYCSKNRTSQRKTRSMSAKNRVNNKTLSLSNR